MDVAQTFAQKLLRWRGVDPRNRQAGCEGAGNFTQEEAAERLGVPLRTYQDWEQGRRIPRGLALRYVKQYLSALDAKAPVGTPSRETTQKQRTQRPARRTGKNRETHGKRKVNRRRT